MSPGGGALLTDVMALSQGCTSLEVTSSRRDDDVSQGSPRTMARRLKSGGLYIIGGYVVAQRSTLESCIRSSTLPTMLEFGTLDDVTNQIISATHDVIIW